MMSLGLLVPEGEAITWRGPMIHSAVQQFLRDVAWGALDYLVFDMPPGTGDAQLSLSQLLPLSGAVMVTTPQAVALLDVRKGLAMFRKLNVPIIGVVENMSYFVAPDTGARYPIFGEGGGRHVAEEFAVPLLGQIPLEIATREGGDAGMPVVAGRPDSAQAKAFREVAAAVVERVRALAGAGLPTIS
jgi:ATP-binding protein involved in chromosome partitioning